MDDNSKITDFLKELISLPGISGYETPVAKAIAAHWKDLTDEIQITNVGNLYGIKKGSASKNGEKPHKIILAAHMDGIGMVIDRFRGEMLHFAPIGGFDPRILPGQQVLIHSGKETIPGVIVQLAPHLLSNPYKDKPVPLHELVIDTGLEEEELRQRVQVGDIVSYANLPVELPTDCIAGHSLDNRASVAAVTQTLIELQRFTHHWDVVAVGTTQEETTFLSHTVVHDLRPDLAIAIDVTFAKGPGVDGWRGKPLSSGPSIGYGANFHPKLVKELQSLSDNLGIATTKDYLPSRSGTDAEPIQNACGGVPTALISIPLRYMHTPVEVISMKDILQTGHLMAEFIARLDQNFMNKIVWED
jgi:putative aminopeptidase FrvX